MKRSYVKVGKHFGENPNPKKEQELKEAIIKLRIGNCPDEIKKRCCP